MNEVLERSLEALGLLDQVSNLRSAAEHSAQMLENAREDIRAAVPPDDTPVDVITMGSYARREASPLSDFDYLVMVHAVPEPGAIRSTREVMAAVDAFIAALPPEQSRDRRPGASGLFGRIASAPDLTEKIGLEQDTNISHSRRILILQESESIYQQARHESLIRAILARYLVDYEDPKPGPPRFLLNDVLRYWYTLAVDYQAKRWEDSDTKWGLRYLKLLLSRRITMAGTLVSLLSCRHDAPATTDYLLEQFKLPPLARLAQMALWEGFDQVESLRGILIAAEEFSGFLSDADRRDEVKELSSPGEAEESEPFREMRDLAKELHENLKRLFFETDCGGMFDQTFGLRSRHYLAF